MLKNQFNTNFMKDNMNPSSIETNISNNKTLIDGDLDYSLQKSLEHYDKVLSQLKDTKTITIATDQNIDSLPTIFKPSTVPI